MKFISRDKVIYTFKNEMEHIDTISPGDVIKVETNDCWSQQFCSEEQVLNEIDHDILNPATGPIYVEGAEPGDLLEVKVISIDVEDKGNSEAVPNEGVLGEQVKDSTVKIISIEGDYAIFNGIKLPINPMIGVIGVAPAKEEGEWGTGSPWKHGGNMDTNDIIAGTTLYFPVHQKGALLALGDCHALMGDGEVCFTGLEIPAVVTLEVNLIKNKTVEWPLLETKEHTMVLASGDDLEAAVYEATNQATACLNKCLNMKWEDAYILTSLVVDLKISQVVDPKMTVRAAIPKYLVSTEKIIESL